MGPAGAETAAGIVGQRAAAAYVWRVIEVTRGVQRRRAAQLLQHLRQAFPAWPALDLAQARARAEDNAGLGLHPQHFVRLGEGYMAGEITEVVFPALLVLGRWFDPDQRRFNLLIGKRARGQVQVLLRQAHRALIAVQGFVHHAIAHATEHWLTHGCSLMLVALLV